MAATLALVVSGTQAESGHHHHGAAGAARLNHQQLAFHDAMRKLWEDHITWTRLAIVSFAGDLPDLSLLARSFDRYLRTYPGDGPLPRRLVDTAARLFTELCGSAPARVVLHGDLHHENVLRSGPDGWLAIDPHGWVGDPGYDLGAILYNPDPDVAHPDRLALVPRRLEQMVEAADMPRERVVAWCFVKAVLSDVWNTEGEEFDAAGHPATRAIQVAGLLEPELR